MTKLLKFRRASRSMMVIEADTPLLPSPDVLTARADGAAVLLDLNSEQFLGLDDTGSAIWSAIEGGGSINTIVAALAEEFDADRAQLECDARHFVDELLTRGLVVRS